MSMKFYVGGRVNGNGLGNALAGIDRVVNTWATSQVRRIIQAFRSGGHGSRGGQQWAAWSPAYAKNRARKGRTNILVDTGVLRQSIHHKTSVSDGKVNVTIGTNIKYAKAHHYGHTFKNAKVRGHRRYRAKAHKKAIKAAESKRKALDKATKDVESARRIRKDMRHVSGREKSQRKVRVKHVRKVKKSVARKAMLNDQLVKLNKAARKKNFRKWIDATRRNGVIPARPIVVFTPSDREMLTDALNQFLEMRVGKGRRGA